MKEFKRFYLWGMNMKFFMGLYFVAMAFLAGILTLCYGGDSLKLLTLLEMLLVAMAIAILQAAVLPDSVDFSKGVLMRRSILWLVISAALVTLISLVGGWFTGLPVWCPWLMGVFMACGFFAMLIGLRWEQEADTVHLNEALKTYQKKS